LHRVRPNFTALTFIIRWRASLRHDSWGCCSVHDSHRSLWLGPLMALGFLASGHITRYCYVRTSGEFSRSSREVPPGLARFRLVAIQDPLGLGSLFGPDSPQVLRLGPSQPGSPYGEP